MNHLTYGWVSPFLAYAMSVTGCLLGIMLAMKARKRAGAARRRLLCYATVAIGGVGIWQSQVLAMLGISLPGGLVRYDPALLALSLVVALVDVGTGLFLVTHGPLSWRRLAPAGVVIGLGAAATSYTAMAAMQLSAAVSYEPRLFAASVVVCVLLAPAALWCIVGLRGLKSTVAAAFAMGVAVCAIHYLGQWAMHVHYRQSTADIIGLSPQIMFAPVVLGGAMVAAMLAFFTIGSASLHELRAIYTPEPDGETIEPRLIEEITARVLTGTVVVPVAGTARPITDGRRPPGPRPTPGTMPIWRSMPVWGSVDLVRLAQDRSDRRGRVNVDQPERARPAGPRPAGPARAGRVVDGSVVVTAGAPRPPAEARPVPVPVGAPAGPDLEAPAAAAPVDRGAQAAPVDVAAGGLPRRVLTRERAASAAENVDLAALDESIADLSLHRRSPNAGPGPASPGGAGGGPTGSPRWRNRRAV